MVPVLWKVHTLSTFLMAVLSMLPIMLMITMVMLLMSLMMELLLMLTLLLLTQLLMLSVIMLFLVTQLLMLLPTQLPLDMDSVLDMVLSLDTESVLDMVLSLDMELVLDMALPTLDKELIVAFKILFILGHIYSHEHQRLKYRKSDFCFISLEIIEDEVASICK